MLFSMAYGQANTAAAQTPTFLESMVPFLFIVVVFYFMMIRPQMRQRKEHQKTLEALKRGDKVLTSSGILGTITGLAEQYITLEVSQGVQIRILRSQISGPAKEG